MFETHVDAEIPIPAIFGRKDARSFTYFSNRESRHWLYVVCKPSENMGFEGKNHLFLDSFFDLLGILDNPTAEIAEVYLVSPSTMNGSDSWQMDLIQKVLIKFNPSEQDEKQFFVFETQNGTQLADVKKDEFTEGMVTKVVFEQI